jgi:hypothetical protein
LCTVSIYAEDDQCKVFSFPCLSAQCDSRIENTASIHNVYVVYGSVVDAGSALNPRIVLRDLTIFAPRSYLSRSLEITDIFVCHLIGSGSRGVALHVLSEHLTKQDIV